MTTATVSDQSPSVTGLATRISRTPFRPRSSSFFLSFEGPNEFALPWLITTVKRAVWRQARTRRRRPTTSFADLVGRQPVGDEAELIEDDSLDPCELVLRGDEIAAQRSALAALPTEQHQALFLSALELSHREIAELTGWSPRQIRRYIQKGNETLCEAADLD